MACASPPILCATCETLGSEKKPKPGILLCTGCQKHFCSQHIVQHRQDLTSLLENTVLNERNVLQEKISTFDKQQWSDNIKVHIEMINKWELDITELIKQSAACARERLQQIALKEGNNLQKQFAVLSSEIETLRENGDYLENDIDQLSNKLQQLQHDIEHFRIELTIKEISHELIVVKALTQSVSHTVAPKPLVQSVSHTAAPCYFVDLLLTSQKPKVSIDLSPEPLGPMYPISDQVIAFSYECQLPTLDIVKKSWASLRGIDRAIELHWSSHLKRFLVLAHSDRKNEPNKLYQFDLYSENAEEIWVESVNLRPSRARNFKTLTCFKNYILIVVNNKIEKWLVSHCNWYNNEQNFTDWSPPISCKPRDDIECIRMNDRYYALVIKIYSHQSQTPMFSFQLRNHGMLTLYCMETDYNKSPDRMRLISLPNECGWLFFFCGGNNNCCYVLDNDGKRYDQNIVLLSNVTDIAVQNNLVFLRKKVANSTNDVLEIYEWQK
ncbi:unnamed protein product [Adineta steineri]|uniref:B box-type domain-containing protein n=1 Tax=Adineta steineri TaxID=433720 RepID=A0A813VDJ4_9BILA|nr:unnamed protein product [Adineta steineri]CAF0862601.1 unnamed protein product [Adineta steineri]CAF3958810.1 unnamed protein product [Adineta steineri]CAF4126823.1 unnamed protein product [Adineta steineri]